MLIQTIQLVTQLDSWLKVLNNEGKNKNISMQKEKGTKIPSRELSTLLSDTR